MRDRYRLGGIGNDELLAALVGFVQREHDLMSDLLAHLAELDERRLYLDLGVARSVPRTGGDVARADFWSSITSRPGRLGASRRSRICDCVVEPTTNTRRGATSARSSFRTRSPGGGRATARVQDDRRGQRRDADAMGSVETRRCGSVETLRRSSAKARRHGLGRGATPKAGTGRAGRVTIKNPGALPECPRVWAANYRLLRAVSSKIRLFSSAEEG